MTPKKKRRKSEAVEPVRSFIAAVRFQKRGTKFLMCLSRRDYCKVAQDHLASAQRYEGPPSDTFNCRPVNIGYWLHVEELEGLRDHLDNLKKTFVDHLFLACARSRVCSGLRHLLLHRLRLCQRSVTDIHANVDGELGTDCRCYITDTNVASNV
jgi:hypothetical protein